MVTIVDYGVGNLTSIKNMLKKAGVDATISNSEAAIVAATKLLLPGMGHFDNCMQRLNASGLRPVLEQKVMKDKTPVLAICVGLQMFMKSSEEGVEKGLEWIDGYVVRFSEQKMEKNLKIPNMGWLEPQVCKPSALLNNLEDARFYFAHSYHVQTIQDSVNLLTADYGYSFIAAIEYENIKGVQFHPEKSHRFGMQLLKNFALSQ